ncbi:hypothetical protein [Rhizobium leguminosarum]|uniref:hypothetical protein n=1 Tax=Rhizobium leguminosarum TaxID=384 RepID=UPI00103EE7C0|nr:hypothetical protein [Rhizobium leguminosarum]TBZ05053.1 hypothetical protein E0H38_34135 [Rhizobium leguminosarum bv. viciae]
MGVPDRFAIEYPQRCLQLMNALEGYARDKLLVGSFALLAAASVLTIPYERMKAAHPLYNKVKDDELTQALRSLRKTPFLEAPFWQGESGFWFQTRVMNDINNSYNWEDEEGYRPLSDPARNTIGTRKTDEVLRPLRNALAHGNIFYLNHDGYEVAGDQMKLLAFASRYEETAEQQAASCTFRLIIVGEEDFFRFVRSWAAWVSQLHKSPDISDAA